MLGKKHPNTLMMILNLGTNYKQGDRPQESIPLFEDVYENAENPQMIEMAAAGLIDCFAKLENHNKLKEHAADWLEIISDDTDRYASYCVKVGILQKELGRYEDAEKMLRKGVGIRTKSMPDSWELAKTKSELGDTLSKQERIDEAKPLPEAGLAGLIERAEQIPAGQREKYINEARERVEQLSIGIKAPSTTTPHGGMVNR